MDLVNLNSMHIWSQSSNSGKLFLIFDHKNLETISSWGLRGGLNWREEKVEGLVTSTIHCIRYKMVSKLVTTNGILQTCACLEVVINIPLQLVLIFFQVKNNSTVKLNALECVGS